LGSPQFSLPLSVDYPASDPAITGAGGTTLPGPQVLQLPSGKHITIEIPHERAWGWDWLAAGAGSYRHAFWQL
jgi:kumamolisin